MRIAKNSRAVTSAPPSASGTRSARQARRAHERDLRMGRDALALAQGRILGDPLEQLVELGVPRRAGAVVGVTWASGGKVDRMSRV